MPKPAPIRWTVPDMDDSLRSRSAIVGPYRVTVWRNEPGSWHWEACGADEVATKDGRENVPAFYGAPSLALAQRDAVAWAVANADHARHGGKPPVVWAVTDNRRRPYLANPGGADFEVEPSPYRIRAAEEMVEKARKRDAEFMAEEAERDARETVRREAAALRNIGARMRATSANADHCRTVRTLPDVMRHLRANMHRKRDRRFHVQAGIRRKALARSASLAAAALRPFTPGEVMRIKAQVRAELRNVSLPLNAAQRIAARAMRAGMEG